MEIPIRKINYIDKEEAQVSTPPDPKSFRNSYQKSFQVPVVQVAAQPVTKQREKQGPGHKDRRIASSKAEKQVENNQVKDKKYEKTSQFRLDFFDFQINSRPIYRSFTSSSRLQALPSASI